MADDYTVEGLGKRVKAQHPNSGYGNLSDAELGKRWKAKYPGKYDMFVDAPAKPPEPEVPFAQKAAEFGKGAVKGLLTTARGVNKFTSFGLSEMDPETRRKEDELLKIQNKYQGYGKTTENVAEAFVPIPGLSSIKAAREASLLTKMGVAAARGGIDAGLRTAAQTGSLKEGAEGAAFGAGIDAAIPLLGHVLKAGATRQYGKILHPEGRTAEEITKAKLLPAEGKGVPGVGSLLEQKGVIGTSREALAEKFSQRVEKATAEMNRSYQALGPQAKANLTPVMNDLADFLAKNTMLPNGTIPLHRQKLYEATLDYANRLIRETGGSMSAAPVEDVRAFRQFLDDELWKKKLKINPETAEDTVQLFLRTSIQKAIHAQHPSTELVDAKVHFWKAAADLMGRARTPDAAQSHIARTALRTTVGALAGEEYGRRTKGTEGAIEFGLLGAAASEALDRAFKSVAWSSVSAVAKTRIANLIASGKGQAAADFAARLTGTQMAKPAAVNQ